MMNQRRESDMDPALSAMDWREFPTALPAMKVCLFSNPR